MHIDSAVVEVLGTSFDVRITNNTVSVAVATGKVGFTGSNKRVKALLNPGLMGMYANGDSSIRITQNSNQLAWRTGEVKFSNSPLPEVLATIEQVYEVGVDMAPSLNKTRVTATINNLSLEK
ncbi:FecR family protein [Paraflavitalea speifideaquila]|uniref:FecR family protein n=1 Tax=Paraflavitalea speifideaquila TaxID=3076558 RepID=UPI0028F1127D|nr:FecR domain-containing protein [Paraflavitalea speifideiaquila]